MNTKTIEEHLKTIEQREEQPLWEIDQTREEYLKSIWWVLYWYSDEELAKKYWYDLEK